VKLLALAPRGVIKQPQTNATIIGASTSAPWKLGGKKKSEGRGKNDGHVRGDYYLIVVLGHPTHDSRAWCRSTLIMIAGQ
jgi:hypothetical protein